MSRMSRQKGKRGEREWAARLCRFGFDAMRGQQRSGLEQADVVCDALPGWWWEVKRTESLRLYAAMQQAVDDAGPGRVPVVAHRRNGKDWLCVLRADDLLRLVQRLESALAEPITPDLEETDGR